MKVIDAHLHLTAYDSFNLLASSVGSENNMAAVRRDFDVCGIAAAVAMGNVPLPGDGRTGPLLMDLGGDPTGAHCDYPDGLVCCLGLRGSGLTDEAVPPLVRRFAELLPSPRVAGIKIYTGYDPAYAYDRRYFPFYELAAEANVPVVFHMGETASGMGRLKYAHPLTIDDIAPDFPSTRFVIAHCGCPWFADAVQVALKNPNVWIDLSGLAAGRVDSDALLRLNPGFWQSFVTWITYLGRPEKLLYGTDWPLVDMSGYLALMKRLIPEDWHERVFYQNALDVFPKIRPFLA